MDLGLDGRVYLVTGGSRGLGFAAVARLAQNAAAAEPAAWVIADNADPATPGRLIAAARERFGRLDGALISVGGSPSGTVATTTDEEWRSAFESVFLGAVRLARILAADLGGAGDGRPMSMFSGASTMDVNAS
jgi:3-oxoacyl-[acyl-carrier protein] reductase